MADRRLSSLPKDGELGSERPQRVRGRGVSTAFCGFILGILIGFAINFTANPTCYVSGLESPLHSEISMELETLRAQISECKKKLPDLFVDEKITSEGETEELHSGITPILTDKSPEKKVSELKAGRKKIEEMRQSIYELFDLTPDQAHKSLWFAGDSRERLVARMQASLAYAGGSFEMVFTGMSVCAGHGSYFNESYPVVVETALKPAFEAVGIRFVSRNACMGGTYTFPYAWCLSNIVGSHVDVVSWDFGMMEAGRPQLTEGWLHQALKLNSKPAILFMAGYANRLLDDSSGGAITSESIPHIDSYRRSLASLYQEKTQVPVHAFWAAPSLRERYDQVVVPEEERGREGWDNYIELKSKTTDPTPPALRDLRWYSKKGLPGQASWHPAPKEHAIFGKLLATGYMDMLLEAVDREIHRLTINPASKPPSKEKLTENQSHDLARSKGCQGTKEMFCDTEFQCATSYEPRQGRDLTELIKNDFYKKSLAPADNTAISEVVRFGTGYLDRKYAYKGSRKDGILSFRLHHVNEGKVIVCEPTYGWRKPDGVLDIATEAEFYIDTHKVTLPDETAVRSVAKNCVLVTAKCPKGGHDLLIQPLVEEKDLYVSFVLWS